ncbi:hypothetical protein [Acidovorax sp. FHTAMBA]|uniref:hypothetical protein n=1 Tax=Acidovorax sp. FHTAMBA TaxID=3140252 RepID=UPI0015F35E24
MLDLPLKAELCGLAVPLENPLEQHIEQFERSNKDQRWRDLEEAWAPIKQHYIPPAKIPDY